MKALTVQQPWAWAIVHGGKDVENRTQAWSYRGPLAIHAGLRTDVWAYEDDMVRDALGRFDDGWVLEEQTGTVGAVIGVVDLVGAHRGAACDCISGWAQQGAVHMLLANPRPLPTPVPCKGRLGLWTPPADVLDQLQAVAR
ncbi:hypothetical protein QWY28_13340 [Nocardioides sp. SOB77]|uniref:ASCH domain-containing protein n=1 Tax=Nocardioides oceani TaxID=3058369 RepID=A0ABT8FH65_9ACTN|nr:hypothetical protein [Nocardioides oceani]MDN4173939.1 hypothetical protein [Nocardioides oceani]